MEVFNDKGELRIEIDEHLVDPFHLIRVANRRIDDERTIPQETLSIMREE